ncbi:MAG TPA: hypothetical protein DDZ57_04915 [Porphyromonadaceae bacterium]|jgi:hypothetical protein|nr:hypothetical protein [Porphyromonadaceae bacterium]
MMLAIVIPYYNTDYFDKTMLSLACQTDKRFKVYIGNNNSPDDPGEILENYRDKLDIVYKEFNNERNPVTLSEQFLQCASMISNEEWFMILGDDDILEPNVVSDFYRHLPQINKNQINVVKYSTILINMCDDLISTVYKHNQIEKSTDLYIKKITNRSRSSLSEHIFRTRQFLKYKIPYFPLAWYADDMMILLYSNFDKIYCISDSVVAIRLSGKNISSWENKHKREKIEASILFYSELITKHNKNFNIEDLKILYKHLIYYMLNNYNSNDFSKKIKRGIKLFGTEYTNNILLDIKYPVKYNVANDEIKTFADNYYINTFCFYNNRNKYQEYFSKKKEFRIHWIKSTSPSPNINQKNLNSILTRSIQEEDDVIIICFDNYRFKRNYSKYSLFKYILIAKFYQADILFGNGSEMDYMCKIQDELYWVNNIKKSNFIVLYRKFFNKILDINLLNSKSFPETISALSHDKLMTNDMSI